MLSELIEFSAFHSGRHLAVSGAKAGTLARLQQTGALVPDGFIIPCTAFDAAGLNATHLTELDERFAALRAKCASGKVAVRSSSLHEDTQAAAHAGEYLSVLNVATPDALRRAVQNVFASGAKDSTSTMAVFVQEQVDPDYAGVFFTLDPVSGNDNVVVGNFVQGLADALLTGERDALTFSIEKRSGAYSGAAHLQALARAFLELAARLEQFSGTAVDVEWAVRGGQVFVLQCRPITAAALGDETWNDTLKGDYLWTNTNTGEAFNGTLTPLSGTSMANTISDSLGSLNGASMAGLIAGRLYLNLSWSLAVHDKLGTSREKAYTAIALLGGTIPEGITVPDVKVGYSQFLRFLGKMLRFTVYYAINIRFWTRWCREDCPAWCEDMTARIAACENNEQLLELMQQLYAKNAKLFGLLLITMSQLSQWRLQLEDKLRALLSPEEVAVLLSGLGGAQLESLQPLLGFAALMRGEISREEFIRRYGHRSHTELEIAEPRPAEDPAWLDMLARQWAQSRPENHIRSQHTASAELWRRLLPRQRKLKQLYDACSKLYRERELLRSEAMRIGWLGRKMVLKAHTLNGLHDELFFLEDKELWKFFEGDTSLLARVPARKRLYERYRRLPPLPSYISGTFRPFLWEKSAGRRTDIFDSHRNLPPPSTGALKGFPGSAGIVEGRVRRLDSPQQFGELVNGEVLVTSYTNIGWTLLFPRVSAIVTDIGAPLSHTSIVAREMGIPAVVGTGTATSRLKTGDRVRVNGSAGTVELLP